MFIDHEIGWIGQRHIESSGMDREKNNKHMRRDTGLYTYMSIWCPDIYKYVVTSNGWHVEKPRHADVDERPDTWHVARRPRHADVAPTWQGMIGGISRRVSCKRPLQLQREAEEAAEEDSNGVA